MTITVTGTGDELELTFGPQPPCTFVRAPGSWQAPGLDTAVCFDGDTMIIRQYGRDLRAARVATEPS
jgi:hypothetical protein